MTEQQRRRFNTGILIGLFIVVAGAILLLENLDMGFGIRIVDYWPVILILIGLGKIMDSGRANNIYWGLAFIGIGTLFLLNNLGVIVFWFDDLWPILIILVGISIIRGSFWKPGCCKGNVHIHTRHGCRDHSWDGAFHNKRDTLTDDHIKISTVLGGGDYKISNKALKGGHVDVVMGGVELDFTKAEMDGDRIELEASVVMGSIEIRVPSHWEVVMEGSPVMGSMENRTVSPRENGKRFVIKCSPVLGAIEVKS